MAVDVLVDVADSQSALHLSAHFKFCSCQAPIKENSRDPSKTTGIPEA